jgi:hypothetical protein
MFPIELIITILRVAYEYSCPLLTINKPYDKNKRHWKTAKYIKQFWGSRNKNKKTAQHLKTFDELVVEVQKFHYDIATSVISSTISALMDIEALWVLDVDTNGSNIKKLLLTPLGLEIWTRIDEGSLLNQKEISYQYLQQIFTKDLLLALQCAERIAWLDLNQKRIAAIISNINSQSVCLGFYLLLNGAIGNEHALHLIRTDKKDFKWHETITEGLNEVAKSLFGKNLFTIPSLKDDLQRRSELIQKVGSSLVWYVPRKGALDEYYWWEIGDYREDSSILDHIVYSLVKSVTTGHDLESIQFRLEKLIAYFIHKVDNTLPQNQMSTLFSNPPHQDFDFALQASFKRVLEKIGSEIDPIVKKSKRKKSDRKYSFESMVNTEELSEDS